MKRVIFGTILSFALVTGSVVSSYSGINFPGDKKKKCCKSDSKECSEAKKEECKNGKKSCCKEGKKEKKSE